MNIELENSSNLEQNLGNCSPDVLTISHCFPVKMVLEAKKQIEVCNRQVRSKKIVVGDFSPMHINIIFHKVSLSCVDGRFYPSISIPLRFVSLSVCPIMQPVVFPNVHIRFSPWLPGWDNSKTIIQSISHPSHIALCGWVFLFPTI